MNKIISFFLFVIVGVFAVLFFQSETFQKQSGQKNVLSTTTVKPEEINKIDIQPTINLPSPIASPSYSQEETKTATIKTEKGEIILSLYTKDAPNTVKNFTSKAKSGFYNNLTFHRVEDWVIQGGDPLGNGTGGGKITTELNDKPFVVGSLGVARGGDIKISNDAQFFITKKDSPHLNNQYINFGIVTKGVDVVEKIQIGDKILGITVE